MITAHRRRGRAVLAAAALLTLAACGSADTAAPPAGATTADGSVEAEPAAGGTVTLITHDSFAVDADVLAAFEQESGIEVKVLAQGDSGSMLSQLILTASNPLGDIVFGIDNTFAGRALQAGILEPGAAPAGPGGESYAVDDTDSLAAIDFGDVCVNVDHTWFAEHDLPEPATYEDLADPRYRDLFVTPSPATSSPGLAFLLGTIAHFGQDGWTDYWSSLVENGVKITGGWSDAYGVDFSGSSGKGDRPLVLSYASSPPFEVTDADAPAPTGALLDTCFRQVEYAGVLAGAKNPAGAATVLQFLQSPAFQAQIPEQMYVYPVHPEVELPADWAAYAATAEDPAELPAEEIAANRESWIEAWSDLVQG